MQIKLFFYQRTHLIDISHFFLQTFSIWFQTFSMIFVFTVSRNLTIIRLSSMLIMFLHNFWAWSFLIFLLCKVFIIQNNSGSEMKTRLHWRKFQNKLVQMYRLPWPSEWRWYKVVNVRSQCVNVMSQHTLCLRQCFRPSSMRNCWKTFDGQNIRF